MEERKSADDLYAENVELRRKLQNTERALEEYIERYRLLFENSDEGIFLMGVEGDDAGKILAANSAMAEMYGYHINELLGMRIINLDAPEIARAALAASKKVLKLNWKREETTHRRKDGSLFPVELRGDLIHVAGTDYFLGISVNLTDRKRAENARREQARSLRAYI